MGEGARKLAQPKAATSGDIKIPRRVASFPPPCFHAGGIGQKSGLPRGVEHQQSGSRLAVSGLDLGGSDVKRPLIVLSNLLDLGDLVFPNLGDDRALGARQWGR